MSWGGSENESDKIIENLKKYWANLQYLSKEHFANARENFQILEEKKSKRQMIQDKTIVIYRNIELSIFKIQLFFFFS